MQQSIVFHVDNALVHGISKWFKKKKNFVAMRAIWLDPTLRDFCNALGGQGLRNIEVVVGFEDRKNLPYCNALAELKKKWAMDKNNRVYVEFQKPLKATPHPV